MRDFRRVYYGGKGFYPDIAFHALAMAYWAYQPAPGSDTLVASKQNLTNVLRYRDPNPLIPSMVAGFDGQGWQVAIEGTTDARQWMNYVLRFGTANATGISGTVFKVFNDWSNVLLPQLSAVIGNTEDVALAGHSLGGALAVLLGEKLFAAGKRVKKTITFACPRIGDVAIVNATEVPTHNVRTLLDVVPHAPPPFVPVLLPDAGTDRLSPQLFRPGTDYLLGSTASPMQGVYSLVGLVTPAAWATNFVGWVADAHRIGTYVARLWTALSDADRAFNVAWYKWLTQSAGLRLPAPREA